MGEHRGDQTGDPVGPLVVAEPELVLSVVIAALGVVNTLALSVIERTREIGLLRAVGMDRRNLRRMIRYEAVMIAVFGAVLGLGTGVIFGWAFSRRCPAVATAGHLFVSIIWVNRTFGAGGCS